MNKYNVGFRRFLECDIEIEAETREEAIRKAEGIYNELLDTNRADELEEFETSRNLCCIG